MALATHTILVFQYMAINSIFISRVDMHGKEPISKGMRMYRAHHGDDTYQCSPRKYAACRSVCRELESRFVTLNSSFLGGVLLAVLNFRIGVESFELNVQTDIYFQSHNVQSPSFTVMYT